MKLFMLMALLISQVNSVKSKSWEQELTQWKNTIGSADDNSIRLPHGPVHLGSFYLDKENISLQTTKDSTISANDKKVSGKISVKIPLKVLN